MSVDERLRVPIGSAAATWSTRPDCRRVLVIAHTVTSVTRLLDLLPIFDSDPRIQVVATRARTSNFREGVTEFLTDLGFAVAPWEQAVEERFDLAVSASLGDDMHLLRAPLIVVSHGAGYNKLMKPETGNRKPETGNRKPETGNRKPETGNRKPETGNRKPETGNRSAVFGLSTETLVRDGRLVPSVLVLSHPEQLDRLGASCPEAVPSALVAGDPTYDRILAGRRWRAEYRRALDVGERRMVLVSSTWGPSSLLGRRPELLSALVGELPADEYRVVFAAHPNAWHGHGPWQLRNWLASSERAGLRVLPPRVGWQAALVAADHVIGDHGSVTFYGAALGTHTMLGTFPHDELDPASPIAEFGRTARLLAGDRPLRDQLVADADRHRPDRFAGVTRLLTSLPEKSARVLRTACYRLMDLPEPGHAVRVTPPEPPRPFQRQWPDVGVSVPMTVTADGDAAEVRVERRPAELVRDGRVVLDRPHIVAGADEPDTHWLESADIVVEARDTGEPWRRVADTLAAHPGARFAAVRSGPDCLVGARGGRRFRLRPETDPSGIAPEVFASAFWRVYTALRGKVAAGTVKVHVGERHVVLRVVPE
ncbi:hypothetical protein [Marinactinospora rubrisoli]|uniref:Uncharacterized protein n=1 Tax=Marinactinospora rubrisoli TaxID=2715399 RepID=A0ABW2KKG2_9ACTN